MSRFLRELPHVSRPVPAAELRRRGVSKHLLAGQRWMAVHRGFYRPVSEAPLTPTQRIVDAAVLVPPGGALAGWAAAFVHGVDVLDGLDDRSMSPLPVPVRLPPGLHRRGVEGIRYVQARQLNSAADVADFSVTTLRDTVFDLAHWAPNLTEAVVAIDAVLGAKIVSPRELDAQHLVGPGARQIKQAVELSSPDVRSTWESRLRVFCVLALGFPAPLVNRPIFDLSGTFLGAPDLLDEEAGLAVEYDGSRWQSAIQTGHRDALQHHRDNHREEGLERANLIVVRVDKIDLSRERAALARRLHAARAEGLGRDRTRDRWTLQEPSGWWGMPA